MAGPPLTARREQLGRVAEHYRLQAEQYADRVVSLVGLSDAYGTDQRSLLLDLAGSGRMGQIRAAGELERAQRLHDSYPHVLDLLRTGALLVPVVEMLLRKTKHCSEDVHRRLGRVLPGRLVLLDAADAYEVIARTVLEVEGQLEAEEQQRRQAQAKANRGVWVFDVENGMARVGAEVDAVTARQFALDLDELVRAEAVRDKRDGVVRTTGQRRADVLMELPARYRALLEAVASGKAEELRERAVQRDEQGRVAEAQDELPLDLPPPGRPSCWALDVDELAIELFRVPVGARPVLNVHVPMGAVLGLDESPARIDGGDCIPAWMARLLVPDAALRRVAVSAGTGIPLYLDPDLVTTHLRPPDTPPGPGRRRPPDPPKPTPLAPRPPGVSAEEVQCELAENEARLAPALACQQALLSLVTPLVLPDTAEPQHDPSAGLRRLVEFRDQRCTGPGCRRPARWCDLDHEVEYAKGGPTSEHNLSAKSRRCHLARHHGWSVDRDPRSGTTTWTSPDGQAYRRLPAWVAHPCHEPVVRLGAHPIELPGAESDFPGDRPLWRPRYASAPRPTAKAPSTPRTPPAVSSGRGWDDGPPPF